ncbi:hypothetical protein D9619_002523 [Psilocybe cf. subviscida]|uniref:Ankyrin n=1 Tax=Psilocybe cf. subviscida TaxID=2480587 RepID=A0A8H5ETG5_9AGAR|nr:hypothetical protein D9619_002523 [Psilocybe cf. subviscida]
MSEEKGASANERLLSAARTDNEDLLLEVFEEGDFDINCTDGKYPTPLDVLPLQPYITRASTFHILHPHASRRPVIRVFRVIESVIHGSTDVLEHILSHEECDVDPVNTMGGSTPLHLAVAIEHSELRLHIFESLLEAGADTTIKDKYGETVMDILGKDDPLRAAIRKNQAQANISRDDIAHDDDDESGSGSGSEE